MCKETLEEGLVREPGVREVRLDVKSKILTVRYNPRQTTLPKLQRAVTQLGYDADELEADAKAHDRLAPCCQKTAPEHTDGGR